MRNEILDRQAKAMQAHGLDAMISCSPENVAYATGFVVPTQPLIRHRHAMVIVDASASAALFAVDMEESTIKRREPRVPRRIWREFSDDPMVILASQLTEKGLAASKIGIEMDYLPVGDFLRLQAALPKAQFSPCQSILSRLRQIKNAEEILLLRRLSLIADQAITDALTSVKAGDTEMDIAGHLTRNIYELGAEQFKLLIIATGDRSRLPNVGPTTRKLVRGDVCRTEIFAIIDGYQAGVCRTAVVQEAPPMAEEIWKHLIECKYEIMAMVKPGASCREIYDAFIKRLAKANLPPISFVGHGIGLRVHEEPYLGKAAIIGQANSDALVEENMVLGFEPLCYETGYGYGMQNKDMLLVNANGSELLSNYTDTDRLLVVK